MAKKAKILILLSLIPLALVLYLVLTSEWVSDRAGTETKKQNQTVLPEEEYKNIIRQIFSGYEKLSVSDNFTLAEIEELRSRLLALKGVPAQYRDLHYNLVQSLDRLEDYANSKDQAKKFASLQIANQLKADNSWLND